MGELEWKCSRGHLWREPDEGQKTAIDSVLHDEETGDSFCGHCLVEFLRRNVGKISHYPKVVYDGKEG